MPPFRAEQMGSLLRPQKLLDIREAMRTKGLTAEVAGLPEAEKEAVGAVVAMQRDLGFKAVTSGEFVRTRFWGMTWDEFDGMVRLQDAEAAIFRLYHPDVISLIEQDRKVMPGESVIAGAKLRHNPEKSVSNIHELRLVQQFVPESEWGNIKLTVIAPTWFHMRYKEGCAYTGEAYENDAEYYRDVAKAYGDELKMLYEVGLRNVQFDDPGLAYFCSNVWRDGWAEDTSNNCTVDDLLDAYIALYNDIISQLPADMHTGVHLCRGNFIGGKHFAEGAYDVIAEKLFTKLAVNTFYLEYDTARAGGFGPLRLLPRNKYIVLGVISTKLSALEDKEEAKKRIYQAADMIAAGSGQTREEALARVCVSPQCGFSTHESGYPLTQDDEKKKLALVRQIADEIWGQP